MDSSTGVSNGVKSKTLKEIFQDFRKVPVICTIILIIAAAAFMRFFMLGNPFLSSDNLTLGYRMLKFSGFTWILFEQYGIIIAILDKLIVSLLAFSGITVTEFVFKMPIALMGVLQVPLTFLFLRRLNLSLFLALMGSALIAVFPLHISDSRYLYGYELFGVFFLTMAIWSLLNFFEGPTRRRGITASIFSGLYIISHGYFLPFFPVLVTIIFLFSPVKDGNIFDRFKAGLLVYLKNRAWLFLLILFPFTTRPWIHLYFKKTSMGFYLFSYLPDVAFAWGLFIAILFVISILINIFVKKTRSTAGFLFIIVSIVYLMPLWFGSPPGVTVARGYMLISLYSLMIYMLIVFDRFISINKISLLRPVVYAVLILSFLGTAWGSIETFFFRDKLVDPALIHIHSKRGSIIDTGVKAAGYIVRKYVPANAKVFAMHQSIEEENLFYYFNRDQYAYNDMTSGETIKKFNELSDKIDVVLCSNWQAKHVESDKRFIKRVVVKWDNLPQVVIYSKKHIKIPGMFVSTSEYNKKFDNEYSWNRVILGNFFSRSDMTFSQQLMKREKRKDHRKKIRKYLYFLFNK
ncbi:hypothetical protein ACFL20_00490 [Spirochaetota bacterium]